MHEGVGGWAFGIYSHEMARVSAVRGGALDAVSALRTGDQQGLAHGADPLPGRPHKLRPVCHGGYSSTSKTIPSVAPRALLTTPPRRFGSILRNAPP